MTTNMVHKWQQRHPSKTHTHTNQELWMPPPLPIICLTLLTLNLQQNNPKGLLHKYLISSIPQLLRMNYLKITMIMLHLALSEVQEWTCALKPSHISVQLSLTTGESGKVSRNTVDVKSFSCNCYYFQHCDNLSIIFGLWNVRKLCECPDCRVTSSSPDPKDVKFATELSCSFFTTFYFYD